nr:EOG090X03P9 [Cyclestheria hislopi]
MIHSRLRHPSILQLHTFFEDNDFVYLVLDLCENGELQRYLKALGQPLTEWEAREVINQVVEGMLYLHSQNILHRDLSLANLLLARDMKVKIADFGLATQLSRPDEKHMTMCGTPNYISPEVATRSSHGLEADVWGLGCLLYTLLVGRPPFDTDAVKSTLTRVVMADFKLPSNLSPEAKDLIQKLLKKNPKERLPLTGVLDHPFMKKKVHCEVDSGLFTMSTLPSVAAPSIKPQPLMLPKLRRSNSNKETNAGPVMAFPKILSNNKHSAHSLPEGGTETESRTRKIQSWGEPYAGASPWAPGNECNRLSCHHNPCHHSETSCCRSIHCSHHMPCHASCSHMDTCKCHARQDAKPVQMENGCGLQKLVPPLCTTRLKPTRQRTKNAVCSILEQGDVCLEFIRKRSDGERVVDVCTISSDGMRIILFQPNNGRGVMLSDTPTPLPAKGSDAMYSYENLPAEHWKKYVYASRFVSLVKAKTPKIILYTAKAKCLLMENGPNSDFEAMFYSGTKLVRTQNNLIITEPTGGTSTYSLDQNEPAFDVGHLREFWIHFKEGLEHCERIEDAITQLTHLPVNTLLPLFPLTIGRRPNQQQTPSTKTSTSDKENQVMEPVLSGLKSFDGSVRSSSSKAPPLRRLDAQQNSTISRSVHVPGIGQVIHKHTGDVEVHFVDGSRIGIVPNSCMVSYSQSSQSNSIIYNTKEPLPEEVRSKLSLLPQAVGHLVHSSKMLPSSKPSFVR